MSKIVINENDIESLIRQIINESYKQLNEEIEFNNESIQKVLESYLGTLLWVDEELDGFSINEISDEAKNTSRLDIENFIRRIGQNETAQIEVNDYDEESFGHNFALSRNGHGAGFFDENNNELQNIARNMGEAHLYVGDDGIIHLDSNTPEISEAKNKTKKQKKFNKVMDEFGKGELYASYGDKVTDPKQAVAIAYSESGQSKNKKK